MSFVKTIRRMWAIDPGGVHVGVAEFVERADTVTGEVKDWVCLNAWEWDPERAIDEIAQAMLNYHIDVLVVEEFRLYPDKAMAQTGSTMPTCELIGQIKWAHRLDSRRRRDAHAHDTDSLNTEPVEFVLQPAAIQEPTKGLLRVRGIKSIAKRLGAGGHALSAELHGWHYLLRSST